MRSAIGMTPGSQSDSHVGRSITEIVDVGILSQETP
jgi:hypothetical protein